MLSNRVLVLNQNYEPINVCQVRRALVLIFNGKAEVTENNSNLIRSPSFSIVAPSVVRLAHMVKRSRPKPRLTRRKVFIRDHYTCQYCGRQVLDLTLDHVIPRHAGGEHTWENVVSACKDCNQKKAGHAPKEAKMKLLRKPFRPSTDDHYIDHTHTPPQEWFKYLPQTIHHTMLSHMPKKEAPHP